MTLELCLAINKLAHLKRTYPHLAKKIAVEQAAKFLESQGFSYAYSKDVARQAWDLV